MNDDKRIAINTGILTIKLIINIIVSFIVSRLLLQALGVDDYGLYNVIGGIVVILNLVGTSMVATSYRYLSIEIGKKENGDPQKVYSTLSLIHLSLALALLVFGGLIGLYYVSHFLNITSASTADASFVLIFSLIAASASVIAVPSGGLLIARENFLVTASVDILRSILNLVIAIILLRYAGNRLRLYAVLMAVCAFVVPICYYTYCRRKDREIVRFRLNKSVSDYKDIGKFAGWTLMGASAVVGKNQGAAVIINHFFQNAINASFGVASQVSHAAALFASTIRQAAVPQIMKNLESDSKRSLFLVYTISRYTFMIVLVVAAPLLLNVHYVLKIWLGANVPIFASTFVTFLLITAIFSNLDSGFDASIQATGKIKGLQIGYTLINLSLLPIIYILYKLGFPPYVNVIVEVFLIICTVVFKAFVMKRLTDFTFVDYFRSTIFPAMKVALLVFLPLVVISHYIPILSHIRLIFICFCIVWTIAAVIIFGISSSERQGMFRYVRGKFVKEG